MISGAENPKSKVDDLWCSATLLPLLHPYILLCWNGRYDAPLEDLV